MANYAALVDVLAVAGSRLSDGTPNASGTVWFMRPGTNTEVSAYSDAAATTVITQPVTLTEGGTLNRSDFPDGIYVTQPVRLLVQDVNGTTVVDTVYIPATAGDVGVSNAGFTDSTLDGVLTKAYTSFKGRDFTYLIATGQTERPYNEVITEIHASVTSFGAVGDGVAIDTTAIQNTIDYVTGAGGGIVWFPPGTYKTDQALNVSSATGVRLVGAGSRAAIIATTHATAATIVLTSCTACTVENIRLEPAGANSSNGVSLVNSADTGIHRLTIKSNHAGGLFASGTSNFYVTESSLLGTSYDLYVSGTGTPSTVTSSVFAGTGTTNVFLTGTAADISITNCRFRGTSGIEFDSGLTGTNFVISGCPTLGSRTNPLVIGTATLPVYRQWGNGIEASATSGATGAAQTPVLYKGSEVILTAASGGAGAVTVNAPAILPGTSTSDVNLYWDFVFKNAAGGAVTWTLNAIFVLDGAAAIPTTDGHTIMVRFRWDRSTSELRECSRSDTLT